MLNGKLYAKIRSF